MPGIRRWWNYSPEATGGGGTSLPNEDDPSDPPVGAADFDTARAQTKVKARAAEAADVEAARFNQEVDIRADQIVDGIDMEGLVAEVEADETLLGKINGWKGGITPENQTKLKALRTEVEASIQADIDAAVAEANKMAGTKPDANTPPVAGAAPAAAAPAAAAPPAATPPVPAVAAPAVPAVTPPAPAATPPAPAAVPPVGAAPAVPPVGETPPAVGAAGAAGAAAATPPVAEPPAAQAPVPDVSAVLDTRLNEMKESLQTEFGEQISTITQELATTKETLAKVEKERDDAIAESATQASAAEKLEFFVAAKLAGVKDDLRDFAYSAAQTLVKQLGESGQVQAGQPITYEVIFNELKKGNPSLFSEQAAEPGATKAPGEGVPVPAAVDLKPKAKTSTGNSLGSIPATGLEDGGSKTGERGHDNFEGASAALRKKARAS